MPYFIILPVWLLVCLAGLIMLAFRPTRLVGALALTTSTAATILSFLLSLAGMLGLGSLATAVGYPDLSGLAAIAGYIGGMVVGGLAGAALAAVATIFVWHRSRIKRAAPPQR